MWDELAIAPTDDPKVIRRAYAARLRQIDPDRDRAAFARLRQALEWALARAQQPPRPVPALQPASVDGAPLDRQPPDREPPDFGTQGTATPPMVVRPLNDTVRDPHAELPLRRPPPPPPTELPRQHVDERTLLVALESALQRRDGREASGLYVHASATGALPFGDAERMLGRLFTVVLEDSAMDAPAFRALAKCFAWDRPELASAAVSDVRARVTTRLAAEDWYDALVAVADRRRFFKRTKAVPARLLLRRIRRPGLIRVDRAALKANIDAYRRHEMWLRDRISPPWVAKLEARIRRRELIASGLGVAFFGWFLLQGLFAGVAVFVDKGFSPALLGCGLVVGLMIWVMRYAVRGFMQRWRRRP
jgi:hypothetical protein